MTEQLEPLIIVHATQINPEYYLNGDVLRGIRQRALATVEVGKPVFFLDSPHAENWVSRTDFSRVLSNARFLPFPKPEELIGCPSDMSIIDLQGIKLKSALVEDKITSVNIVGTARSLCVNVVDHIVRGSMFRDVAGIARFLNTDYEQLRAVVRTSIRAHVIEQLCI